MITRKSLPWILLVGLCLSLILTVLTIPMIKSQKSASSSPFELWNTYEGESDSYTIKICERAGKSNRERVVYLLAKDSDKNRSFVAYDYGSNMIFEQIYITDKKVRPICIFGPGLADKNNAAYLKDQQLAHVLSQLYRAIGQTYKEENVTKSYMRVEKIGERIILVPEN